MKIKLTRHAIAALFVVGVYGDLSAQDQVGSGIDVSNKTSIKFNTEIVTKSEMDQANAAYHQHLLEQDPKWDLKRNAYEQDIQNYLADNKYNHLDPTAVVTIPVVVHVLWQNATQNISDNQVFSQILVVNQDHSRTNPDANQTPAAWTGIAANTNIQFCLAQRDPNGNATNGIERRNTTTASFSANDGAKHFSSGGLDAWDPTRYLNIWVCNLGGGLLGYGEFPTGTVSQTFGVVILYSAFGSSYTTYGAFSDIQAPYDRGRTVTHEFSHCLNLYHIWGDDGGACSGSDLCADTPNQADATTSCFTYPHTDACTTTNPGIMFYNYMDYSFDNCLNLFTANQATRMNAVLNITPYNALKTSNGCQSLTTTNNDAGIASVTTPNGALCSNTFIPKVVLKNFGANTLTACKINYKIDATAATVFNWSGSLATNATVTVTLGSMTTTGGAHTFTAYTTLPNNVTDTQASNDQTIVNFTVVGAGSTLPLIQGFEGTTFPPVGWALSNPDNLTTWARTTGAAKTGAASCWFNSFNYTCNGCVDILTTPNLNLTSVTAPQMTFQVAYQMQTNPTSSPNFSDTLEVDVSTNCGTTWTQLYRKYGTNLTTIVPTFSTVSFIPTANNWRLETISLASYASSNNAYLRFKVGSDYENNLYLDDINIFGNPTGESSWNISNNIQVYPNPTEGTVYLNAAFTKEENLKIFIYNVVGEEVGRVISNNTMGGTMTLDLSDKTNGVYFLRISTDTQTFTQKVVLNR